MKSNLNKQQEKLLDILKWFHKICIENGLRYYALGGTMLGAIRHRGFIPWDDDIDIGMPRKDYEKFIVLCTNLQDERFFVETVNSPQKDYFYGYTKIYDKSTTLIEKTRKNIKRGIYIDLFPLDGAGNSIEEAKKIFNVVHRKYQLVIARTCAVLPRRKWYKNAIAIIARMIPELVLSNKNELIQIDRLCQTYAYDDCKLIGNFLGNWGLKEVMPKDVMGIPTEYEFEDTIVMGAQNPESYLTSLYGDWRKLPPVDKRISLHDYVECDLYKSYLE